MEDTIYLNLTDEIKLVWKYTHEIAMLKTLLQKNLITRREYELILARIRKDYKITDA